MLRESAQSAPAESSTAADPDRVRPKYAQIRPDQWNDLDAIARDLMDSRTDRGRRITGNTLIRIAIDALVAQKALLVGNDEEQLRAAYFERLGIQKSQHTRDQES